MTTLESPLVRALYNQIHSYDSAIKYGGSVPGPGELTHSYHNSWDDSPHDGGYSVYYWGDCHNMITHQKTGPGKGLEPHAYACAIDLTMDAARMKEYTGRLVRWANSGRKYWNVQTVREFAGTLDGKTVYAMDMSTTKGHRTYGWDNSHLWHIHISINRRLILDPGVLTIANIFK